MKDGWDRQTALNKAARFCAYQERSVQEVRKKLSAGISSRKVIDQLIEELIENDFINEERFLHSFIKGKFFQKRWGRIKIRYALRMHEISDEKTDQVMQKLIGPNEYKSAVRELADRKLERLGNQDALVLKGKVFQHLASKGYEQEIIYVVWNELGFNV